MALQLSATSALKPAVAENVKKVTDTNFKQNRDDNFMQFV
ncbi:7175_t:CDS:2 [Entrophospora sp. SA101]|nr:7175_t:CDS:2 [Entrophospora sp. SA101]